MDRQYMELVGFAAKAMGRPIGGTFFADGGWSPSVERSFNPSSGFGGGLDTSSWDPLGDDGDCARMEAALLLNVVWDAYGVRVEKDGCTLSCEPFTSYGQDRNLARRYASTIAASNLGRRMD